MKKKVVLIRPSYSLDIYGVYEKLPKNREVRPPLGLMYLAGALEADGHEVYIIDAEPDLLDVNEIVLEVLSYNPHFVGITATTPEFPMLCEIAIKIVNIPTKPNS